MIKKLWNFLGDVRLSFWLLLAAAALFFAGSFLTSIEFSYFRAMNEVTLQKWLARELPSRPEANWWLVPLLAVLSLLGLNAVICTANRMIALFSGRTKSDYRFIVSLLPSAVHLLFIAVMLGHAATITMGTWSRVAITEGSVVRISPAVPDLVVRGIEDAYFPGESLLAKRIRQTRVTLAGSDGSRLHLSYLDDLRYGGYRLHLDMEKKKTPAGHENRHVQTIDGTETCNRSEIFRSAERKREPAQKLYLLAIADPGLPIIFTAFTMILVFMTWYFIEALRKRDRDA